MTTAQQTWEMSNWPTGIKMNDGKFESALVLLEPGCLHQSSEDNITRALLHPSPSRSVSHKTHVH